MGKRKPKKLRKQAKKNKLSRTKEQNKALKSNKNFLDYFFK
jgi:hypothetical protein